MACSREELMITTLFDKKTAIAESQIKNSLPFSNVNDVGLKENDLILNPVNNILNHFLDNDLYLEQLIINILDSRNVPGPLVTGLSDIVVNGEDDKKYVLTSTIDDTQICKRKFSSNNDSIISVEFFNDKCVNFIFNDGRYYLAGTDDDWYISEKITTGWRKLKTTDLFKQSFQQKQILCFAQNSDASLKVENLSGYSYFLGLNDGLFGFCISDSRTTEPYWTEIPPPNTNNLMASFFNQKAITDVYSNPNDGLLYATTEGGELFSTDGFNVLKHSVDDNGKVKKVVSVNDEKLIEASEEMFVATTTGIKQSTLCHYLLDDSIALSCDNPLITTIGIDTDGKSIKYVGTTNGISATNSNKESITIGQGVTKKLLRAGNKWLALADNNLYYNLPTSSYTSAIVDFTVAGSDYFYLSSDIVYKNSISVDLNQDVNQTLSLLKVVAEVATGRCLVLGNNKTISALAISNLSPILTTDSEGNEIPLTYSLSSMPSDATVSYTSLGCIGGKPVVAFSLTKNDFTFNYLSSPITVLTMTTDEPVISIESRNSDEIILTTNSTVSVYNNTLNTLKQVKFDFSNTDKTDNPITHKFPIHSLYLGKDTGYAVVNSRYVVNFSKHTVDRLFRNPFGTYEVLNRKFKNLDIETLYVPRLDSVEIISNLDEESRQKTIDRLKKDMFVGGANFTGFSDNMHIALKYVENTMDAVRDDYITGKTKAITETTGDSDDEFKAKYIFSSGTSIYKTITGYSISKELYSILPDDCEINYILAEDTYNYIICTTKGMFLTDPIFKPFDQMNINSLESVSKNILDRISAEIDLHIKVSHLGNPFLTALDKKCPAKLDAVPENFTTITPIQYNNSVVEVKSDVVKDIEFNDVNRYIKASVSNWATEAIGGESIYSLDGYIDRFKDPTTGEEIDLSEIPYTYKLWNSGLKEFYIYLPTTLTYYINNPKGFSNSIYTESTVPRHNLGPDIYSGNTISENYTKIRVILNNNHFNINSISQIEINGSSLPLKIYKEAVYCQEGRANIFDSVIQPSLVVSFPATTGQSVNNINNMVTSDNDLIIEFAAYGSDAQSIKIIAY